MPGTVDKCRRRAPGRCRLCHSKKRERMRGSVREAAGTRAGFPAGGGASPERRAVSGEKVDSLRCAELEHRRERVLGLLREALAGLGELCRERVRRKMSEGCAAGVERELKDLIRVLEERSY